MEKREKKPVPPLLSKERIDHYDQASSELLQPWYSSIRISSRCLIHTSPSPLNVIKAAPKHDLCNQLHKRKKKNHIKSAFKKLTMSESSLQQHLVSAFLSLFFVFFFFSS